MAPIRLQSAAQPSMLSAVPADALRRKIQRRLAQRKGNGDVSSDAVHAAAEAGTQGAGGPLPYLDQIQKSFGRHEVSGIQAHTDDKANAASKQMGAEAYASGNHVAFAGAPSLHTVAHEAAHVVQQAGGVHLAGGVGAEGDAHEQHADAVADRVVAGRSAEDLLGAYSAPAYASDSPEGRSSDALAPRATGAQQGTAGQAAYSRSGEPFVQHMKVRGTVAASQVSGVTHTKHVVATGDQAAAAQAEFGSLTCVTSDALLTAAVDKNAHNFTEASNAKSGRVDVQDTVKIYQWDKTAGPKKGDPSAKTLDGVDTLCEIGATKGGDDIIKVTHFKKV